MDKEYVSRSRLFREAFLPGAFTRLRNQAYGRVMGIINSGSALDGVDKEQLREAVLNFVNDWESAGGAVDPTFMTAAEKKRLEIQSPSEVSVSPAPLILSCKRCKVLDFYDTREPEDRHLSKMQARIRERHGRSFIPCKRSGCPGEMIQLPYVSVHRCGYASPVHIQHAARRSTNIGYRDSGSFFHSSFFDVESGDKLSGSAQDKCQACSGQFEDEVQKRGTPLTSGESFYAQSTQYIALSEERGKLIAKLLQCLQDAAEGSEGMAQDVAEGVILALLKKMSGRELEQKLIQLLSENISDAEEQVILRTKLEKKKLSVIKYEALAEDDEDLAEMLDSTRKEVADIEAMLATSSGCFSDARTFISQVSTMIDLVSNRRTLEAVFLPHDVQGRTITQEIDETSDKVQREALSAQWQNVQERYGIDSITHIPDLRVVLAALGYTREKSAPSINPGTPPVVLNAFADRVDEAMKGKTSIYAMAAKTEAIWIRLDARKLLRWCVDAAYLESPSEDVFQDKARSHAYLLSNYHVLSMPPGRAAKDIPSRRPEEGAPFNLLHSISHALMLTARRHTGYDSKSIQEYLIPMDLSVILYVSSVQNYTAGGLLTLFQHYLQAWLDDASMFAFNCAFDPVCTDVGNSCSGCVQIEIGCETFNQGLSRAYIHGGAANRECSLNIRRGFWAK
ncbi:hypothetical protein V2K16_14440 [Pseudomonas alliivorans]|uniref:hypothetical protein n=1 Tax=Pseudomonas alliivorans TaxID=2810613 RepID=UPI001AE80748|nr:hypothetical protein [Pseudomonas alliivorans]MBP0941006.1 hypothetical protein [Pseudomonas alliivorans]MEE4879976.1 hypothetical protein [Pseudomonas alliivorans]MEE4930876.1 hypothetical protein [Pseudomonas alliivorans]MEE4936150.1 hypothetical protein [Pseudomonas alliivorans]MEE4940698.1 hypothetical protein [Pseudomonas alliivorans]